MAKMEVRLILEILGRPAEHIVQGLKMIIDKMKTEKGVKIQHFKIMEPTKAKDTEDLFTTFAEVEVELEDMNSLFLIVFNYMPSNIELISPENITLNNNDLNHAVNQIVQRLHQYDSVAKGLMNEREFLVQKLREVAPHLFQQQSQSQVPTVQEVKQDSDKKEVKESKVSKKKKSKKN